MRRERTSGGGGGALTGILQEQTLIPACCWADTGRLYLAGVAMCPECETFILQRAHVSVQTAGGRRRARAHILHTSHIMLS